MFKHRLLILFLMATKVHNNGIQGNVFIVYVKNASEFESTGDCTTRTEKLKISFLKILCTAENPKDYLLHRCSDCPEQSQLQTLN
jgi:hypothetical protein